MLERAVLRDVCAGCGWSAGEFRDFYLNGAERVLKELREAVAAGDPRDVARIAHGWAGSTATAGVVGLVPVLRRVEAAAVDGRIEAGAPDEIAALLERVRKELDRWCDETAPGISGRRGGASPS